MSQILIDPYQNVQIPFASTAGAGRVERIFCPYARDALLHSEDYIDSYGKLQPSLRCEQLHVEVPTQDLLAWRCGLTNNTCLCLFDELDDPQWAIIVNSIMLEDDQPEPA